MPRIIYGPYCPYHIHVTYKLHIDALAGATLTSNGVDNLVKFWMGESGFKKFLNNLQNGAA